MGQQRTHDKRQDEAFCGRCGRAQVRLPISLRVACRRFRSVPFSEKCVGVQGLGAALLCAVAISWLA